MNNPKATSFVEDALLSKATGGDIDALSALLNHHGPQVRQELSIGKQWRSVLDADDVMQVTYIEAFLQIGRFVPKGSASFLAWLRRIAQNNVRDAVKALEREKRPPPSKRIQPPRGDDSYVALYELLGATSTTPSRAAARQESKRILGAAIARLPQDYATAVRLHDLEGRTGPEVATAMGRSRGATFMLLARAHDRLRENMGAATNFFSH